MWKSQLQTYISLSTLEAEYSVFSFALRVLLPILRMMEILDELELPEEVKATILSEVFEDNKGCYFLATNHRITNRTKYFQVKYHWFWYYYAVHKAFAISHIQSELQDADYLTKQIPRDAFERNRKRVQGW